MSRVATGHLGQDEYVNAWSTSENGSGPQWSNCGQSQVLRAESKEINIQHPKYSFRDGYVPF